MASRLPVVFVLALCVLLSASDNCKSYKNSFTGYYNDYQKCKFGSSCCGTCTNRYCCYVWFEKFSEQQQDKCPVQNGPMTSPLSIILGLVISVTFVLIGVCCGCCRCCFLYKLCHRSNPVINSTTHTTVVTTIPQQYPQQEVATPGQPAGFQNLSYQATPMQPGYGAQPMPQTYGAQPMPQTYGAQPMPQSYGAQPMPTIPLPTYQEARESCPAYPPNPMHYSQAAFNPDQAQCPLLPPAQPQPNVIQPAYNPDYVGPQPKTG